MRVWKQTLSALLAAVLCLVPPSSARRHHQQNSEVAEILTAGLIASILMKGGGDSIVHQVLRHSESGARTHPRAPPTDPMVGYPSPVMIMGHPSPVVVHARYPPAILHVVYPVVYQPPRYVVHPPQKTSLALDAHIRALEARENMLKAYMLEARQNRHQGAPQREVFEQIVSHGGTTILGRVNQVTGPLPREQEPSHQMSGVLEHVTRGFQNGPPLDQMPGVLEPMPNPGAMEPMPRGGHNPMSGAMEEQAATLLLDSTDVDEENAENILRHYVIPEVVLEEQLLLPASGIGGPRAAAAASEIRSRYLLPRLVKHVVRRLLGRNKRHQPF